MDKNTQQPVAWAVTVGNDVANQIGFFTDKAKADACFVEQAGEKYASLYLVQPLYTATPVPRDVLMAALGELRDQCAELAAKYVNSEAFIRSTIDLSAIADRYASKVQPESVNQQLLAALKDLAIDMKIAQGNMRIAAIRDPKWEGCAEAIQPRVDAAEAAIAAAEAAQPVESGEWRTNDPNVSDEHIKAIAKACGLIPSYTTRELVDRVVGFGHVLLRDKAVQEKFVEANAHLLRMFQQPASAQPVAVPDTELFAKTIDDFEACGETDTPQDALLQFASAGWLHCVMFEVLEDDTLGCVKFQITNAGRAMLSAAQKPEGV